MKTFEQFQAMRYFPQLDGLRAISVILVLAIHMRDDMLRPLNGHLGVIMFFTISGFLITTLLLREERRDGKASMSGFYIRRAFRIFPLYYLALLIFSLLVLAGFGDDPGDYGQRLVYFLTYTNEFASPGTFGHSWSLGVEEKYYLVWPLLAFLLPFTKKHRLALALLILAGCVVAGLWAPPAYFGLYVPILTGVVVAILMDSRRYYDGVMVLARPAIAAPLAILFLISYVLETEPDHVHVLFSFATALMFPALIAGHRWMGGWLSVRPLIFVGQRSYGIYLFHPLVVSVVDLVVPAGGDSIALQLGRFIVTVIGSIVVADILYRLFERPLMEVGRRLSRKDKSAKPLPAADLLGSRPATGA